MRVLVRLCEKVIDLSNAQRKLLHEMTGARVNCERLPFCEHRFCLLQGDGVCPFLPHVGLSLDLELATNVLWGKLSGSQGAFALFLDS